MKKVFIFLSLLILTGLLAGCSGIFDTATTEEITFLTSKSTTTTTSNTINKELVLSDLYEMIYEQVYNDVLDEVMSNISQDTFDQIYADIVAELLQKVDDGEITLTPESIVDIVKSVAAAQSGSVVGVTALDAYGEQIAVGSGIIYKQVDNKYYVVTNNHVVTDGVSYEIEFEDGSTIGAVLRGVDSLVDVAVLYFITDDTYPVAQFADSSAVEKGDIVLAVGNPNGYDFFGSVTMGIVSGLDRYFDIDNDGVNDMFVNYIQHDAAINPGNSGGALFNTDGKVIGINVIKLSATDIEGMGFAIPSNLVSAICDDIETYGYSLQKPFLGINFVDIKNNEDYFTTYGIVLPEEITEGFYIIAIDSGGSLYGYVQPGDIIVQIADIELTTAEDFVYEFSKYIVGDTISIVVYRGGQYLTIEDIVLKARAN
ncbi:MAG TPA: trypsin-like peptidase domain-containing protein [Bacillota bacterium]|nr:trypsin-like peptidase domain-containing protein [Bacillota bacterium]